MAGFIKFFVGEDIRPKYGVVTEDRKIVMLNTGAVYDKNAPYIKIVKTDLTEENNETKKVRFSARCVEGDIEYEVAMTRELDADIPTSTLDSCAADLADDLVHLCDVDLESVEATYKIVEG